VLKSVPPMVQIGEFGPYFNNDNSFTAFLAFWLFISKEITKNAKPT